MPFCRSSLRLALGLSILMPTVQVQASQATVRAAFENLQYALTVEWDQRDPVFRDEAIRRFSEEIESLRESGITRTEIAETLKDQALDQKGAEKIERFVRIVKSKNLPHADFVRGVQKIILEQQETGASWRGRLTTTDIWVGVAALVIVVAYIAIAESQSRDNCDIVSPTGAPEETVCNPTAPVIID